MYDNISAILESGKAIVNLTDGQRETPLHKAVIISNDLNMLTSLMKGGSDPTIKNLNGYSPLDKAVRAKNVNAVAVIRQYEDIMRVQPMQQEYSIRKLPTIMLSGPY